VERPRPEPEDRGPAAAPSLAGRLLVASPTLVDPNFRRTVVLLLEHGEGGALGLVVNRPLAAPAEEFLPQWAPFLDPPRQVFFGGPVQREMALGLAWRPAVAPDERWHPVLGGLGMIDVGEEPDRVPGVDRLRIFSGYSGWAPGQLELELTTGSWFVLDAWAADAFSATPDILWREVLRRQGGRLALFAGYPDDPRLN